ncbi:MAG: hypothetical protein BGO55_28185 [Sphingobacteriales bacterium 50-39]|nr:DUF4271 domain-containing protein [Sphingobacteriales bacterium]OJW56911.1 MAG: hypothetical protein BGO55_28185 [Sphingobacteriales bacterium 50-39]
MHKFSFLLLPCLLFFGNLFAQVDSTTSVRSVQDTTVVHPMKVRSDSAIRADSIARAIRRHRRDSLRRDSLRRDTLARHDSARASVRHDSVVPAAQPVTVASPVTPAPVKEQGPPAMVYWMRVLSINPYFNFFGKWVPQPFEPHKVDSKDSLFYLLVGILFYFALIRIFFEKYYSNLMTLFFRVSLRQQQIREQVLQTPLPSLLLNILFILTGGLYACFLLHYSQWGADINFWLLYVDCIAGLAILYLGKFVILKFCGWVLNISRATDTYIFVVFLVNKMLGIFLLPFLIVITFSSPEVREIVITISFVMIFAFLVYRVIAAYRPVRNEIKLPPFYFFSYICAFEIAPLLLIYKVLLTYLGKV